MTADRTHADVIRAELRHGEYLPDSCPGCLAELALDALLAELGAADQKVHDAQNFLTRMLAAEAQLVAAREALTLMATEGRGTQYGDIARAALAASGTPPSSDGRRLDRLAEARDQSLRRDS